MAAYEAYSKSFDSAPEENRKALNDAVQSLHDGKNGYPQFYEQINRYIEGSDQGKSYRRAKIEGQRKQEYNKSEAKRGRNERYRS